MHKHEQREREFCRFLAACKTALVAQVMLAAGLVARNARSFGLRVPAHVKTSLSPGSGVVTRYLEASNLLPELEALGYHIAGYGQV